MAGSSKPIFNRSIANLLKNPILETQLLLVPSMYLALESSAPRPYLHNYLFVCNTVSHSSTTVTRGLKCSALPSSSNSITWTAFHIPSCPSKPSIQLHMPKVIVKRILHMWEQLYGKDAVGVEIEVMGGTDTGIDNQLRSKPVNRNRYKLTCYNGISEKICSPELISW